MTTRLGTIGWLAACAAALAVAGCGGGGGDAPGPAPDTAPPSVPSSLVASAASTSQIDLSWSASSDQIGVAGYRIYRAGAYLDSVVGTTTADAGLAASTQYCYAVSAYDAAGNESARSVESCATTGAPADTTAPSVPAGVTAAATSSSGIDLSWNASTDDVAVAGYRIYRDGLQLGSVAGTSASDDGLAASTEYCYAISAYDAAGNESGRSTPACASTQPPDTAAPTVPSGLSVTPASDSRVSLSWTASDDEVGVTGYRVYRDGTYLRSVTATSALDSGLAPASQYCYAVSALDAAGNESLPCAQSCATTLADTTPPSTPQNLTASALSSSAIGLSWSASTDNGTVAGYKIHRDGVYVASVAATSTSDTGLTTATTHCYRVSAYDTLGNESGPSNQFCATTTWSFTVIDGPGNPHSSIAIDASGNVHISYAMGGSLKYATNASGAWVVSVVDGSGSAGGPTSLDLDTSDRAHVAYLDFANGDLRYATNASGAWATTTVDDAGDVGHDASLRVDSGGAVHISYSDWTNADLKYATNGSGAWTTSTIDSADDVGDGSSLALDSSGKIHVSYLDATRLDLKYATNASGTWVVSKIHDYCGGFTSIALDASDRVHVAFADSRGFLGYVSNRTGWWVAVSADGASGAGLGTNCSLALDGSGYPHVSYYDTRNHALKKATTAWGPWSATRIDGAGTARTSIAIHDGFHISYSDGTGLKYATNR